MAKALSALAFAALLAIAIPITAVGQGSPVTIVNPTGAISTANPLPVTIPGGSVVSGAVKLLDKNGVNQGVISAGGALSTNDAATQAAIAAAAITPPLATIPDASIATGYQQLTNLISPVGFTPPALTTFCNFSPEVASVRVRTDGVNPTPTVGMPIQVSGVAAYRMSITNFASFKVIQQAAGAILDIDCYKDQ